MVRARVCCGAARNIYGDGAKPFQQGGGQHIEDQQTQGSIIDGCQHENDKGLPSAGLVLCRCDGDTKVHGKMVHRQSGQGAQRRT